MEIRHGKNVRIICDLNVGDKVIVKDWGYQLDGKECIIEEIKTKLDGCESVVAQFENFIFPVVLCLTALVYLRHGKAKTPP